MKTEVLESFVKRFKEYRQQGLDETKLLQEWNQALESESSDFLAVLAQSGLRDRLNLTRH